MVFQYDVFLQSTRKCQWERLDDQKEFKEKIRSYEVTASRLRLGPQLVNEYVKQRKREMKWRAYHRGLVCPQRVMLEKRAVELKKQREEYYARKAQEEEEMMLKKLADGLCASE